MGASVELFLVFLVLYFLVHAEHGSIPAATESISHEFNLDKVDLGALGSLIFLGMTVGGGIAGYLYKAYSPKNIQIWSALGMAVGTAAFPAAGYIRPVAYVARVVLGLTQAFVLIYVPVWVDAFADAEYRTVWLTIVQVVGVLGVVGGYALTAIAELISTVTPT